MNYHQIVLPKEQVDAEAFLSKMLLELSAEVPQKGRSSLAFEQGWGILRRGLSVTGQPLCLNGQVHLHGLGTHLDSIVQIILPKKGRRLVALAGIDDNILTRMRTEPVLFQVEAAGKVVWEGSQQAADSAPLEVNADLNGTSVVTLRASGPAPSNFGHIDWIDLRAELEDGSTIYLDRTEMQGSYFSFHCNRRNSSEFWHAWKLETEAPTAVDDKLIHRIKRTDPDTGIQVTVEITLYQKFPVVEWVLRFKNTGSKDTPILENIQSLHLKLPPDEGFLNYHTGDYCAADGYEPHRVELKSPGDYRFAPEGGRPTNKAWPYYNIEFGAGSAGGLILAVGWPGQWASRFQCQADGTVITAGQELTHLILHPGEEIRTPLSVALFYEGDRARGQNIWRRWMLAHNVPRPGGKEVEPFSSACMGLRQSEEVEINYIDTFIENDAKPDYWWMDAGWYPCEELWMQTGTWAPDPKRFPRGIRPVSDYAHQKGMKTILWFEPERVTPGTWLYENHPEWLISPPKAMEKIHDSLSGLLFDLGNPEARHWLIEHIDALLTREGIDLYRQDHNFNPLLYWRNHDTPDRQGMTEIRHIEGYLAFWDELRRRHPNLLIDSCAAGGRRNDLETLRRSVPLLRSDFAPPQITARYLTEGNQGHTYGLASWVPFFGAGALNPDVFSFRSFLSPAMGMSYIPAGKKPVDWKLLKRHQAEWRKVSRYFLGDYYPLTSYSLDSTQWIAWQFNRPDLNEGMIQVFRRELSPFESARFHLSEIDADSSYDIEDLDEPKKILSMSGRELIESGLLIEMPSARQASIFIYRKRDEK